MAAARPASHVPASHDQRVIIGVDVRPIQTTMALADVNGKFTSQEIFATPPDPKVAVDALIPRLQSMIRSCRGKKIEGIGMSVPGRVDHESDRLVFAPNLKWRGLDLHRPIVNATGLEVELENSANACVVGFGLVRPCGCIANAGGGDRVGRHRHGHLDERPTRQRA